MQHHYGSPLIAIYNPPDLLSAVSGEQAELFVTIENQGNTGAVINISLTDSQAIPSQWCQEPFRRLALDPQQSGEVVFAFDLPPNAQVGSYAFSVIIDAPEHYPEDTPFQFDTALRVLHREHTVIRTNDSTFFFQPVTNSLTPAKIKPGEVLEVDVQVENRSQFVEKFRLFCLDLEEEWFTIHYPDNQFASVGVLDTVNTLELNPREKGQIQLQLHPPTNTLAGTYSPTFRLYADNQPDLVLLDLVYLEIAADDNMSVEFKTIVSKIRDGKGHFQLKLSNLGNIFRELHYSAHCLEDEQQFHFIFEPPQLRLPPGKETSIDLWVTPRQKRQRPWIGNGQITNFQVEIDDAQDYQLPNHVSQGTLIWKARPWWRLLLMFLAIAGLICGLAYCIYYFFFRPRPIEIINFEAAEKTVIEGDKVKLKWTITNADKIESLQISKDLKPSIDISINTEPEIYNFQKGIPNTLAKRSECSFRKKELFCTQVYTNAGTPGEYKITLEVFSKGKDPKLATTSVIIKLKEDPKIINFKPSQAEYDIDKPIAFSWDIKNFAQLTQLSLTAKNEKGIPVMDFPEQFNFSDSSIDKKLEKHCQKSQDNITLNCKYYQTIALKDSGIYTFELSGKNHHQKEIKTNEAKVAIQAPPIIINQFLVNGQESPPPIMIDPNQNLVIAWDVTGENVTVNITNVGSRKATTKQRNSGNAIIPPLEPGIHKIEMTTMDISGESGESRIVHVKVNAAPPISPSTNPSNTGNEIETPPPIN